MKRQRQKLGVWALIAGLIALSFSACTSAPAPITYASHDRILAPSPIVATSIRPAPPRVDMAAPYWDETTIPRIDYLATTSQCVPFARAMSGIQIWGDAVTWWAQAEGRYPRSGIPAEGSVLVLRGWNDEKRGHVAVVKSVINPRLIRVDHANWMHGEEVSLDVPVIDVSPANDWTEVRVWHVPGAYWGGRIYQAQGFVHPYNIAPNTSTAAIG